MTQVPQGLLSRLMLSGRPTYLRAKATELLPIEAAKWCIEVSDISIPIILTGTALKLPQNT